MTIQAPRIYSPLLLALLLPSLPTYAGESSPLSLGGSYRLRYESLHNAYRAGSAGSDQIAVSQLLLSFKANGEHVFGEFEVEDARSWLDDAGTPLGTDDVNTLEPLQAWIGWRQQGQFAVKAGRLTLDIGSRRLVARQRFRNTINAFDGVYGNFQQGVWQWQAMYLMPVEREPSDRTELDSNEMELDEQGDNRFWGLHISHSGDTNLELYYYGLDEDNDGAQLTTIGFRSFKVATTHQWNYELETVYQSGENGDLDVSAAMVHGHIGYQFADPLSSRIELIADYASGDDDPNDDKSNRFNTLFGVTRFDFGPTGIYGAFARTNIISPGLKWSFKPASTQTAFMAYRAVWLESDTDSHSRSGLRDTTGDSGCFVGHQLEARWRVVFSKQLQLELGGAYLMKGEFFKGAPNAPDTGDTTYVYSQITYRL